MKKRKCKQYLKLVMLLFGVTLVLSSCQKDDVDCLDNQAGIQISSVKRKSVGFEISGTNLFNTPYKHSNSATSFVTSDSKTFILPRVILIKIAYKL